MKEYVVEGHKLVPKSPEMVIAGGAGTAVLTVKVTTVGALTQFPDVPVT